MTDFLIKSTIAMAVLLALYHLLLEREKMHRFNRFYLLFALVFSLVVPFININTLNPSVANNASVTLQELVIGNAVETKEQERFDFILLGWIIYGLITTLFLLRFVKNLLFFFRKANNNETHDFNNATLVLVQEDILPHTFLNYIFVNREDYINKAIEKELYTHELAHIKQRHTLDIIFIELYKIIFWFNPLLAIYKKAIQLNHEFLADEKVITTHHNITPYQNLLLKKASGAQSFALASNLNFSITKKRLLMMTKHTSRFQAIIKQAMVLPLLTGVVYICYSQNEPQKQTTALPQQSVTTKEVRLPAEAAKSNTADLKKESIPAQEPENQQLPPKSIMVKQQPEITQQDTTKNKVYNVAGLDKLPEYPGGMEAFRSYIGKNYIVPDVDKDMNAKIFVSFIVEKDGSMTSIKVLRDPGYGMGDEAVRVIKTIDKKWTPGEYKGEKVRASYTLPIAINVKAAPQQPQQQPEEKKKQQ